MIFFSFVRYAIEFWAFLMSEITFGLLVIGLIQEHNATLGVKGIDHFHSLFGPFRLMPIQLFWFWCLTIRQNCIFWTVSNCYSQNSRRTQKTSMQKKINVIKLSITIGFFFLWKARDGMLFVFLKSEMIMDISAVSLVIWFRT